jgi:condensin complex subunit 2
MTAEAGADPAPKAKREKKEAFRIDFLTPAEKDLKEVTTSLFAPVKRGAGINLPGTAKSRRGKAATAARDNASYLLPDDMHFSSRQLVSLFLKPKFSVGYHYMGQILNLTDAAQLKMRGQRAPLEVNAEGEIDENFWAQAAANQAAQQTEDVEADDSACSDGAMRDFNRLTAFTAGAMPFNTQFFHDDDDDVGFDDAFDGEGGGSAAAQDPGEQDLLAATQGQTRRVKPEFVNYAKRAKRVDVRRLKDNIWKGLDIIVPPPKAEDDMVSASCLSFVSYR